MNSHDAATNALATALESSQETAEQVAADRERLRSALYDAEVASIEATAALSRCCTTADREPVLRATGILSRSIAKNRAARTGLADTKE